MAVRTSFLVVALVAAPACTGPALHLENPDDLAGRTFAVWGLSFKPETDDVREAPALALIRLLIEAGARVRANDPVALRTAAAACGDLGPALTLCHDAYDAVRGAHALLLCTE